MKYMLTKFLTINISWNVLFGSNKIAMAAANILQQITSILFYLYTANLLDKKDFSFFVMVQVWSGLLRYLNFGTPFLIQNRLLTRSNSNYSFKIGLKFNFYFLFFSFLGVCLFDFFYSVNIYTALLVFLYFFLENFFNYMELSARSMGLWNRLIAVRILFVLVILILYVLSYFFTFDLNYILFRYVLVWLFGGIFLFIALMRSSFRFSYTIASSSFTDDFIFLKLSLPIGFAIYLQEFMLIFPRSIMGYCDPLFLGELGFGFSLVANLNIGISTLIQYDYNFMYKILNKEVKVNIKNFFSNFYMKYFLLYSVYGFFLFYFLPHIFTTFSLFKNFSYIKFSFLIYFCYYFIMTLLTPIDVYIRKNNLNKISLFFTVSFLIIFFTLFSIINAAVSNALIGMSISWVISIIALGVCYLLYFWRYVSNGFID